MNYCVCKNCPRRLSGNQPALTVDIFFGKKIAFWPVCDTNASNACRATIVVNSKALQVLKKNGFINYPIEFQISLSAIFLRKFFDKLSAPRDCPYQLEHAVYSANKL